MCVASINVILVLKECGMDSFNNLLFCFIQVSNLDLTTCYIDMLLTLGCKVTAPGHHPKCDINF